MISIYLTGLGQTTPQPALGSAAPSNPLSNANTPPTVFIGDTPLNVIYAGLVPGEVGVYQIDAQALAANSERGADAFGGFARRGLDHAFSTRGESVTTKSLRSRRNGLMWKGVFVAWALAAGMARRATVGSGRLGRIRIFAFVDGEITGGKR